MRPAILGAIAGGGGGASFDAVVTAWLAAAASDGGSVSGASSTAVDAFVTGCKSDNVWSLLRRMGVLCGDFISMKVPLLAAVGATRDTYVNGVSGDYTESLGPQTNGSTIDITTGYTPSEATGGLGVYLRTTQPSDTNAYCPIGASSGSSLQNFRIIANRNATGSANAGSVSGIWGGPTANSNPAGTGGLDAACWHMTRTGGTASALYRNGVSVATSSTSTTPSSATNALRVMSFNNAGTPIAYLTSGSRIGAYWVDSGMTAPQAALFYARLQTLMTALGRGV